MSSSGRPGAPGKTAPDPYPEQADPDESDRHSIAGNGKDLPDGEESGQAEGEDKAGAAAPFAWFAIAQVAPESAPATIRFGAPVAAPAPSGGEPADALAIDLSAPAAAGGDAATPDPAIELKPESIDAAVETFDLAQAGRDALPACAALPAREVAAQSLAAVQPRGEASPVAASVFAGQLAARVELPEGFRTPRPGDAGVNPLSVTASGLEPLRPNVVQAVAELQAQPAVDTRRAEWTAQMIERIEAMRDLPGARETSIRLSPDALGAIDVSIRREGDRIHVRFMTDNPQARALLAEAQPRLIEIAEARGIRLGQSAVDAGVGGGTPGQSGQGERHDATGRPATRSAPAAAAVRDTETSTDQRVA